jgi:hypothetical protein
MRITDSEAAQRAAERENEFSRRTQNNRLLNAAALAVMVYVTIIELVRHGVL